VQLFLATRYPDRRLWTVNIGLSGDTARGALGRYDVDIAPNRIRAAFVHFGMNDVGRDSFIGRKDPFPDAERKKSRDAYRQSLSNLTARLSTDGVRVALLSPTIFDDTMVRWSNACQRPHLDAELVRFGQIRRENAASRGGPAIDLHAPLQAANARIQAADSARGVTADCVHPNECAP